MVLIDSHRGTVRAESMSLKNTGGQRGQDTRWDREWKWQRSGLGRGWELRVVGEVRLRWQRKKEADPY